MNRYLTFIALALAITACRSRTSAPVAEPRPDPVPQEAVSPSQSLQRTIETEGFSSKGTIEAETEVPVYSRIGEQIVGFDIQLGQRLRKGEVVVRLSQDVLKDRIARNKAELEKAEYQYQAILMGQGYKRQELDKAPDEIKRHRHRTAGLPAAAGARTHVLHHHRPHQRSGQPCGRHPVQCRRPRCAAFFHSGHRAPESVL